MGLYLALGMFFFIILFIVYLFIRRKKIENELSKFYKQNQFYTVKEIPENLRQAINNKNLVCLKSSIVKDHKPFEFYWLESFTTSTTYGNNGPQTSLNCFLTIAFPPNTISEEFMQKAKSFKETEANVKDFFVLNTDKPQKVEKLDDGTFLMMWQVLSKAEVYQKKLDWLEENLS